MKTAKWREIRNSTSNVLQEAFEWQKARNLKIKTTHQRQSDSASVRIVSSLQFTIGDAHLPSKRAPLRFIIITVPVHEPADTALPVGRTRPTESNAPHSDCTVCRCGGDRSPRLTVPPRRRATPARACKPSDRVNRDAHHETNTSERRRVPLVAVPSKVLFLFFATPFSRRLRKRCSLLYFIMKRAKKTTTERRSKHVGPDCTAKLRNQRHR